MIRLFQMSVSCPQATVSHPIRAAGTGNHNAELEMFCYCKVSYLVDVHAEPNVLQANAPPRALCMFVAHEQINLLHSGNLKAISEGFNNEFSLLFEWYCPVTRQFELEDVAMLPVYDYVAILRDASIADEECPGLNALITKLLNSEDRRDPALTVVERLHLDEKGWVMRRRG